MKITSQQLIDQDKSYYLPVFARYPLALKNGSGSTVWDWDGNKYLDVLSGIAVNSLGHAHPAIIETITQQASQLMHVSNFYVTKPQADLAKKAVEIAGLNRAFFCNSGAEAMEGAFKLARKYAHSKGKGGTIITFEGCFHGRTLATIAAGKEVMQKGFEPIPTGFKKVPFNNFEALANIIDNDIAAIAMEIIQGEGGINVADASFIQKVKALCDQNDIVLILDEIQCGLGRTGEMNAYDAYGIKPDIITWAKGLGAGFPIGAVICNEKISSAIAFGDHGSTFGGNPLACAVALTSIHEIEKLLPHVQQLGNEILADLQAFAKNEPVIKEIRGKGLMIGVELTIDARPVVEKMLIKGVIGNFTSGKVVRFIPALNITQSEMQEALNVFKQSLKEVLQNG